MRTSFVISVLLGAGALGHPHFKLNNPLGHLHHHKRQGGPQEVKTYVENGRVVVDDIFIKTVYGNGVTAPSPVAAAAPVNEKVAVAPEVVVTAAPVQVHQEWAKPQQEQENHPHQYQQQQKQAYNAPVPATVVVSTTPVAASVPVQTQATAPASGSTSSGGSGDGSPMSGSKSYLTSANYFRQLQGFNKFVYDDTLQSNSVKTGIDNGGNQMKHELNAGSFAQCIAEGDATSGSGDLSPFDMIYLGWLCEIPQANLGDMCLTMTNTVHMNITAGDVGHANILRTASYTKMGCSFQTATEPQNYVGQWTCDFA